MPSRPGRSRLTVVVIGIAVVAVIGIVITAITMNGSTQLPNSPENLSASKSKSVAYEPGSTPYGKTYGEWMARWWMFIQDLPQSNNPVFDPVGNKCNVGQDEGNVWFAAGTTGGKAERICTIPSNKALFIPIVISECSHAEDKSLDTEEKRRACAIAGAKNAVLSLSVDGEAVPSLEQYWVESPILNYTLKEGNIWGVPQQVTDEYAAGYCVMLKPLPPGSHSVHFTGAVTSIEGTQLFALDVKYDLKVE